MVKSILLKFDEAFFYKMKAHKLKLEQEYKGVMSWESYMCILLGLAKKKQ